jgi:hypothetical protein
MYDTQNSKVLDYLSSGRSISQRDAIIDFNIYRLAARVCELRNEGWEITTRMVRNLKFRARHAEYSMASKDERKRAMRYLKRK